MGQLTGQRRPRDQRLDGDRPRRTRYAADVFFAGRRKSELHEAWRPSRLGLVADGEV